MLPIATPKHVRNPALWLASAVAAGILLERLFPAPGSLCLFGAAILGVGAGASKGTAARHTFVVLFCVALGAGIYQHSLWIEPDRLRLLYDRGVIESGSPVEVEGILNGRPELSADGEFLSVRTVSIRSMGAERPSSGIVRVFVPLRKSLSDVTSDVRSPISDLKYGSRVRVSCPLEREEQYLNPGVQSRLEVLDRMGIDATCTVKSTLLIEHVADESVFLPLAWVYQRRGDLIDIFHQDLTPRTSGVMIASLLGDRYFLDRETADLFRDGGTFHILVISGLHITFIGGLLLLFLRRLTRHRWLHFMLTTMCLWAYTLSVGADVPVVRASLMFTIVLLGYAIYRQSHLLNSLGVCAVVVLVWRPSDLFDPSFQLTFVSVAAIVGLAYPLIEMLRKIGAWSPTPLHPFPPNVPYWLSRLSETLYWRDEVWSIELRRQIWTANLLKSPLPRVKGIVQRCLRYGFEAILVSTVVQLTMLPLSVIYFHRVSIGSVLLNIWVGFFIAIESFAAVAGALALNWSIFLAAGFFSIADATNTLMLSVPRLISGSGWTSFRLPAYVASGRAIYLLYFVPLVLMAVLLSRWDPFALLKNRLAPRVATVCAICLSILLVVVIAHPLSVATPDGRLHIDHMDVGQGDSALITFPDGETLLVDGGGQGTREMHDDEEQEPFERDTRGIGEAVVSEVLWAKGYSSIDYVLATHADADHMQGLTDVSRNFTVGSALLARTPHDDPEYIELRNTLESRRVPIEVISRGQILRFGDVSVRVLYPQPLSDTDGVYDNDHSVVLQIVYGRRVFLLTGDIEKAAEAEVLSGTGDLAADVVKVPHHGSHTSSTPDFITATHPSYAIISVGRHSPFGHPHNDVLERWTTSGAKVIRTGDRGMVSVSTDGEDLIVDTFLH